MVPHQHVAFHGAAGVQRHAHDDQQAGTAQLNAHAGDVAQHDGQHRDDAKEHSADQGDLAQALGDEVAGGLARTDAGDGAVVLAQVVGDLHRVVLNGHVEVVEGQDQQQVDDGVEDAVVVEHVEERHPEGALDLQQAADHVGNAAQGAGEDDGHNAAHVHLDGNVARLTAVHLAAHHTLGVLHRDAALAVGEDDHEHHRGDRQDGDDGDVDVVLRLAVSSFGQQGLHAADDVAPAGDDTDKDQQRNAVADALVVDLLAHPGEQLAASGEAQHDNNSAEPGFPAGVVGQHAPAAQHHVVANAHGHADAGAGVAGDAGQLAPALLTLFAQPLQGGDRHSEQLDDDGGVDIGRYAQGEDRALAQRAAAHHVQVIQHVAAAAQLTEQLQRVHVDVGHADGAAQPKDHEDHQGEQDLFTQFGDLPRIAERIEHLRSPRPFRLPSRSFLWLWRCRPPAEQ